MVANAVYYSKYHLHHTFTNTAGFYSKGDRADTGYRKIWKSLGFREGELLIEFGYPTQKFLLRKEDICFIS